MNRILSPAEQIMADLLSRQGYLVLNTALKHRPGYKMALDRGEEFDDQPWFCIAEATQAEADQQEAMIWGEPPSENEWRYPYFYRVGTD